MGDRRVDPWCDPESAAAMRLRILERMRDNGVISAGDFDQASIAELGLGAAPDGRPPCRD
jgi:hypothetical protein